LGSDVDVAANATLGGHGTIGGAVDVAANAHLAPGSSIGTLVIAGDLSVAQDGQLDYEFGAPGPDFNTPGVGDSVDVGGDLSLNGAVLNVTANGSFGPGLYRVFDYAGSYSESNGGLSIGSRPAGTALVIQKLAGDQQINLLNSTGMTLNLWNGNGQADDTHAGGGDGTWSTTKQNWTDADGRVTSAMQPQPGFAIFGGDPGTVTVDNGSGDVEALGLQFASDGYTLDGDELTLSADANHPAPVEIRVGDGSAASVDYTATIDNVLTGSDGLRKTGAGTRKLTGQYSYSGGTVASNGTLSISDDDSLGASCRDLPLDGGTRQVTGKSYTATTRPIIWGDAGGTYDTPDACNTVNVDDDLHANGHLGKSGSGTLFLSGDNDYSGGTTVAAGKLAGDTQSLQGDIANNAEVVFEQSADGAYAGSMSGNGTLTKQGSGTLILSGTNTYSGGTTVTDGLLVGDAQSLQGAIANNAEVVFDHGTSGTYTGSMTGSGALTKQGSGKLTLTGDSSSFAGATDVQTGSLIIGSTVDSSAVLGGDVDVAANAILGGHGTISGDVTIHSGGHMAPGNSIGTTTITGNYTHSAGSVYDVEVNAAGDHDLLDIGGRATLDGGEVAVHAANGNYDPQTDYTILKAAGGVNGQFDSVSANLVFLDPALAYDPNAVILTLTRNDIDFAAVATTHNQRAAARGAGSLALGS